MIGIIEDLIHRSSHYIRLVFHQSWELLENSSIYCYFQNYDLMWNVYWRILVVFSETNSYVMSWWHDAAYNGRRILELKCAKTIFHDCIVWRRQIYSIFRNSFLMIMNSNINNYVSHLPSVYSLVSHSSGVKLTSHTLITICPETSGIGIVYYCSSYFSNFLP